MLQMNCPNCQGLIKSQFLAEVSTIECGQCEKKVTVEDVFITSEHFTLPRGDFLNRTFRFQKLLREVEKERLLMANNSEVAAKSIESLDQFSSSLQELLVGARNSYRMEISSGLYVEVNHNNRKSKWKLVDLSTEGCSIELKVYDKFPRKKAEVKIEFFLSELSPQLHTDARVIWTNEQTNDDGTKHVTIGAIFVDMDEDTHNHIWEYILDNAPAPF
jgi:hypothetical protein